MQNLKKSELKKNLISSVKVLKNSLQYTTYRYFILATLFFYYADRGTRAIPRTVNLHPTASRHNFHGKQKYLQSELAEAFSNLEAIHPTLTGILEGAIPETQIPDADMLEFRRHLDYLQEHTSAFINSENFGNTFEYWLSLLAKMTVKQGVAFYTPRSLVNLLIDITKPREGMSIYDPTVGTGGMLIGAAHYIRQHGGNLESTQFYGREKLQDIWAICNMNILAHQIDNATIEHGDSLRDMEARTDTFDLVLQNIPLSLDPGNRTKTNQMTQAFLEHAVESLSPSGSAAILAPASILQQDHQDFWHQILQRDWLEAVINLPPKLLHGTNTSAVVFIFNKKKPAGRSSQVLFIRVPSNFLPHAWHNELQNVDIQSIVQAFESWGETSQFTRVIHISEIKDQNYNLSIERYPDFGEITQPFDIASALNRYHIASQKREAAVTRLMQNLAELDYPIKPSQDKPSLQ